MQFEWDENKNQANQRKHGIAFEFAAGVFADPLAITFPERIVDSEQRWVTMGAIAGEVILLVAHTVVEDMDEVMRIISARKAKPKERKLYEEGIER
jgi:uncharacterized protein